MFFIPHYTSVKQGLVDENEMGLPNCIGDSFTSDTHIQKATTIPHI